MTDQVNLLPTLMPPYRQIGYPNAPCGGRSCSERFWAKVDRSGGSESCWPWRGARRPGRNEGYGRFAETRTRIRPAHRVAWELVMGPIPTGMAVLHACDNPPCVNPAHLFLGTQIDNIADMDRKGRRVQSFGDRNGARTRQPWRKRVRDAEGRFR